MGSRIPVGKTALYRLVEKDPPQLVVVLSQGTDSLGAYTHIRLKSGEKKKTHPSNLTRVS